MTNADQCVLAGVRATGRLHLGNYLGALKGFVALAEEQNSASKAYLFVADIHTLSAHPEPEVLRQTVLELVMDLLACGVSAERVTIFAQSSVAETAELAWLLATMTYAQDLERMPAFRERERATNATEPLNAGVLNYPVLMAADILGLGATKVAVGEDQYPHLELARDIARRFNKRYPPSMLIEPQPLSLSPTRIPGLDGAGKMGKSQHNTLPLFESRADRWTKLQAASTDPARRSMQDRGTPERCAIYAMHQRVTSEGFVSEIAADCRGAKLSCTDCKAKLNDSLESSLAPLREKREELAKTPDVAIEQLRAGAQRVRATVGAVRDAIHARVGIVRY